MTGQTLEESYEGLTSGLLDAAATLSEEDQSTAAKHRRTS